MRNKFINAFFASTIALVGITSLSVGYVDAAQTGVSAQDKKQLGLFNGDGAFIGTLVGVDTTNASGADYQAYLSSIDAIISLSVQTSSTNAEFSLKGEHVYFSSANCTGNAYVDRFLSPHENQVISQTSFIAGDNTRTFAVVTSSGTPSVEVLSQIDGSGICENFLNSTPVSQVYPSREVSLPFTLTGLPSIKPL